MGYLLYRRVNLPISGFGLEVIPIFLEFPYGFLLNLDNLGAFAAVSKGRRPSKSLTVAAAAKTPKLSKFKMNPLGSCKNLGGTLNPKLEKGKYISL